MPASPSGLRAQLWRLGRDLRSGWQDFAVAQPLRGAITVAVIGVVWLFTAAVVHGALRWLNRSEYVLLKPRLIESLLALFLFVLFFLVAASALVLVWGRLLRSRAADFHAALPTTDRALFWSACVEGGLLASWAVAVLASPVLLLLSREALSPAAYLPAALAVLAGFIAVSVAAGALGALLLARIVPLLRRGVIGLVILVAGGLLLYGVYQLGGLDRSGDPAGFMREVLGRIGFAENPYLPPAWAQQALTAALGARWADFAYFLALTWLGAVALALIAEHLAHRRLRLDLDRLASRPSGRRAGRPWRRWPPGTLALLVAKDLRLFLRDPAQVLQFTMFFGLLGFYLLMLPRLTEGLMLPEAWRPGISICNLIAIAMALATFTARFVFPLPSLEGQRLWLLVPAAVGRGRLLAGKMVFAVLVATPVSLSLAVLSGWMLGLSPRMIALEAVAVAGLAVGLSASALGLGARLADYRQDDPARIVAGAGGTINLIVSLALVGLLTICATLPLLLRHPTAWWLGLGAALLISAVWTAGFLYLAGRWFARLDGTGGG
jgi:ABC-2 type transport system permease protein